MPDEIKIWSSIEVEDGYRGTALEAPDYLKRYVVRGTIGDRSANIGMPLNEANPIFMVEQLIEYLKKMGDIGCKSLETFSQVF